MNIKISYNNNKMPELVLRSQFFSVQIRTQKKDEKKNKEEDDEEGLTFIAFL